MIAEGSNLPVWFLHSKRGCDKMCNHFATAPFSIRKFRLIGHFVLVLMPMKPVFIGLHRHFKIFSDS